MKENDCPQISVIVTLYNVESYVEDCLRSLFVQDYPNYEILVIDDGSSDRSAEIAEKLLAATDVKCRFFTRENKGVSASRNEGIREATGDFFVLVDGDDTVERDFLSSLYQAFPSGEERCVVFSAYTILMGFELRYFPCTGETIEIGQEEALLRFRSREWPFILPAMLLKRDFIIKNGIYFDEDCRFSEDVIYIWKVLCSATTVRLVDRSLYNYLVRSGSTMTSSDFAKILTCREAIRRLQEQYVMSLNGMEIFQSTFVFRYLFAIMHGAAKLLSADAFFRLNDEIGAAEAFRKPPHGLGKRVFLMMLLYQLNKKLFYLVMRRK